MKKWKHIRKQIMAQRMNVNRTRQRESCWARKRTIVQMWRRRRCARAHVWVEQVVQIMNCYSILDIIRPTLLPAH